MKTRHFILSLIALMTMSVAQAAGLTGRDIMQMVKNRADGDTRYATVEMTLIQKSGHKRVRKIESWAMDEGKDTKKIMFFTYPGDVKGTGFLTWDYDNTAKVDDKWLYLPAMKKTRRISGKSSKTDYFWTMHHMQMENVQTGHKTIIRMDNQKFNIKLSPNLFTVSQLEKGL